MAALLAGILIVTATGIALSGKGRALIRGFTNLFFENVAKTPEGADAIYAEAIEEAQNDYNKADNILKRNVGMLETAKTNYDTTKKKIKEVESMAEKLVSQNKFSDAEIYAQEREDLIADLKLYEEEIAKYKPIVEEAKDIHNHLENKLKKLKKDRKTVINKMKMNKQSEELYNDLDELKNTRGTDKLLGTIKDELVSGNERVVGARAVHNNKTSTKKANIERELKKSSSSSYIEELKRKQNK